jgi:hypothetical protein
VAISVACDGRSRAYRRPGFTAAQLQSYAVVTATARKYGLHATASRSFSLGPAEETFKREHLTACKVAATYIASTWPDADPKQVFKAAQRVYLLMEHEHEWQQAPQGWWLGRDPVERLVMPESEELFQDGWAVAWGPTVGAASCCDTYMVRQKGPAWLTPVEQWPLLSLRISGAEILCPHILER